MIQIAAADRVRTIDPLAARGRAERLTARQIFEPLVSSQRGPFAATRVREGIARSLRVSADRLTWFARLRPGVRFTNGQPLDAEAVKRNVERWRADPRAARVVPRLIRASSPRPGRVAFSLSAPDPDFPDQLADGRLGLVAPAALDRAAGGELGPAARGAGPFVLRERDRAQGRTLLARNVSWWGATLGLGPGVDQLELVRLPLQAARADLLLAGEVDVADQLDALAAREVSADPLLTVLASEDGTAPRIGLDRKVRGINRTTADQSLAEAWLTELR